MIIVLSGIQSSLELDARLRAIQEVFGEIGKITALHDDYGVYTPEIVSVNEDDTITLKFPTGVERSNVPFCEFFEIWVECVNPAAKILELE